MKHQPVRKVRSNGRTIVGYINSPKSPSVIQFESHLEKQFVYLLQFDSQVVKVYDQPVSIPFLHRGKKKHYPVDYLVEYTNGRKVLFEVKYTDDLKKNSRKYSAKFKAARLYAREHGMVFKIITEKEIHGIYKENIHFLLQFKTATASLEQQHLILKALESKPRNNGENILSMISSGVEQRNELLRPFWVMVYNKILTCDLFKPLTLQSDVWAVTERYKSVQLSYPYKTIPKFKLPKI
ncbi:MAG: Tn7 transposase TnsA N-terminal domain-containing protein [Cyclobacteriaceae bacterium]|nr:Tn7 transposase TnsA N-terminal domain-containing protein [Cyclobacteriaceae bacterium]